MLHPTWQSPLILSVPMTEVTLTDRPPSYPLVGVEEHAHGTVGSLQAHAAVVLLLLLQAVGAVLPQVGQRSGPGVALHHLVLRCRRLLQLWGTQGIIGTPNLSTSINTQRKRSRFVIISRRQLQLIYSQLLKEVVFNKLAFRLNSEQTHPLIICYNSI